MSYYYGLNGSFPRSSYYSGIRRRERRGGYAGNGHPLRSGCFRPYPIQIPDSNVLKNIARPVPLNPLVVGSICISAILTISAVALTLFGILSANPFGIIFGAAAGLAAGVLILSSISKSKVLHVKNAVFRSAGI